MPVSVHGGVEAIANPKPGSRGNFRWYWLYGLDRRRANGWTELHSHFVKHIGPATAKRVTAACYHTAAGLWADSDLNRVRHGKPPRGKVIGRG